MIQPHRIRETANGVCITNARRGTSMDLNCTFEEYNTALSIWEKGAMIQDAFPFLNATEREFLMTGMDAKEQAEFYGEE